MRWLGSSFAFFTHVFFIFNGVRECFVFLLGLCDCENAIFKSRIPIKLIKITIVNVLSNSVDFIGLCPFVQLISQVEKNIVFVQFGCACYR